MEPVLRAAFERIAEEWDITLWEWKSKPAYIDYPLSSEVSCSRKVVLPEGTTAESLGQAFLKLAKEWEDDGR